MTRESHHRASGPADDTGGLLPNENACAGSECVMVSCLHRANIPPSELQWLLSRMRTERMERRRILYTEGSEATRLYAIHSGTVKLVKLSPNGREHVAAIMETGDLFGLEALFGTTYTSDAETLSDCELCLVSRHDMLNLLGGHPEVAIPLGGYLHDQLTRTRERQMSLGAITALEKFAAFMLHCAPNGHDSESGAPVVAQHLTLRELGGILGLSPETVCRVRSELTGQGIIATTPTGIRILDAESLRRLAGR